MSLQPSDLFVFAGAGVSLSPPAELPMFNWLRDEVLRQLELDAYVRDSPVADPSRVSVAAGLAPEPFMLDLRLAGVALEHWLGQVLDGRPNAAHHALAQLASAGARVWTVNFDRLIERAKPTLRVLAWPEAPDRPADLVKPHGSLGGELIVAADQVLRGLDPGWRERLSDDVRGRTVMFVGYSGRDLDFQPLWDGVLSAAREVLWFDQPDPLRPDEVIDSERRRLLLRSVNGRGALQLMPASSHLPGAPAGAAPNSGAHFVNWCAERELVQVDAVLFEQMFKRVEVSYPPLEGPLTLARASMLGHMGDHAAAQGQRRKLLRNRGLRRSAARSLFEATLTEARAPIRTLMLASRALPPLGRLSAVRERAERKRLTALHREARHEAVLRGTARLDDASLSTLLILRASALRALGSLDEAAALADEALRRARQERHAVRTAHAAFQKAIALLWAERLDAARDCLNDELRPFASLAANRWVAWSHFIEGGLAVRGGDADGALREYALGETLFRAEALMDGVVSVRIARLAAHRLAGDDHAFASEAASVRTAPDDGRDWRWYAEQSTITALLLAIELGEFARVHRADAGRSAEHFRLAARSHYPLLAALGGLGLALGARENTAEIHARRALEISREIGARLVAARAEALLEGGPNARRELFFC